MRSETAYARGLVDLARALTAAAPSPTLSIAVGLFGKSQLEERLMHLIGPKRAANPALRTAGLAGGGLIAAVAAGGAVLLHVSTALAQPAAPAEPPVPAMQSLPPVPAPPAPPRAPAAPAAPSQAAEPPSPPADIADQAAQDAAGAGVDQGQADRVDRRNADDDGSLVIVDAKALSPEARQRLKLRVDKALAEARKMRETVNSPAFQAQLAAIRVQAIKVETRAAALQAGETAKVKVRIAKTMAGVSADEERRAKIQVEKALGDPKIKRQIAEAMRVTSSPEFQNAQREIAKAAKSLRDLDSEDPKSGR